MEIMLFAGLHQILFEINHHLLGLVILVARLVIAGSLHKLPAINIKLAQTVKYYVDVDIPGVLMPVKMSAYKCLVSGEVPPGIIHPDLLGALGSKITLGYILGIKGNDVMVLLYIIKSLVLMEMIVSPDTIIIIGIGLAVDAIKNDPVT